jgi:hypothetical protein
VSRPSLSILGSTGRGVLGELGPLMDWRGWTVKNCAQDVGYALARVSSNIYAAAVLLATGP